jgi:isoleucyl-tRNA synthetase
LYDLQGATRYILPFLDELSNWYVRRSRKRFWKSDNDTDKQLAYKTLHYVLMRFSQVLAPFAPFMADELYRLMTGYESVHLTDWPAVGHVNEQVMHEMDAVRRVVNEGLALRAQNGIKVRQPLASLDVHGAEDLGVRKNVYIPILEEEVNVKQVVWNTAGDYSVSIDTNLTEELRDEGSARELVRVIQQARKDAGFDVDDRIVLSVLTEDTRLIGVITRFKTYICAETLTTALHASSRKSQYSVEKSIDTSPITIGIDLATR